MAVDWNGIEKRWQRTWMENGDFEAEPDGRPKKFITVAYPYPNSPQHIGHGRTYTLADVHARFYRMRGYNVLFPMGFHYTGTPVLGMAKRIRAGEKDILDGLRGVYGVPEDAIRTFVEPVAIADYFHEEIRSGMIEMGYSIDWRREFTTIDPGYQRFIEWQITVLKERGRIIQGSHPVGWCPQDQNPVSQHDTMGDVEPKIDDRNRLVKFRLDDGHVFPVTTLRPETVFGVTNMWANPDAVYKRISVDGGGEKWIVSEECAKKMGFFGRRVSVEGDIAGSELVGMHAVAPHDGRRIPVLGAGFVDPGTGTGLVMSVPAHAPKDYQALADLKVQNHGPAARIEPVPIIATEGYGKIPAEEVCRGMGITDQTDQRLEEATNEMYLKEFAGGKMNERCGRFAGAKVESAREGVADWLAEGGHLEGFPVLENGPIRCRCGAECVVKILKNQWFLDYGDPQWKEQARGCLEWMGILPGKIRTEFRDVVDWLHERACARQQGLGTRLPWDGDWIVESLSDSVIYMAYYTISRFVNDGRVRPENMTREFFDYVLLGKGGIGPAAGASGLPEEAIRAIRDEFSYFYPVDSRHSGRDLVQNHLSFFVLNHVAIFEEGLWPRQIVVNGSVMMDGAKMSKSMGNIIPLRAAVRRHGADPIRLAIISSAELLQDADFNMESVSGIRDRLESLLEECGSLAGHGGTGGTEPEDRWILARVRSMAAGVTESVERMRLREALHHILFAFESDLRWHAKRAEAKGRRRRDVAGVLHRVCSARVAMLAPFAPHAAEEMWERLGYGDPVAGSGWPGHAPEEADPESVQSEALLRGTVEDIASILKVTGITPKRITVYVSSDAFKLGVYRRILGMVAGGQNNMGAVMKELLADPRTAGVKRMPEYVKRTIRDLHSESEEVRRARSESAGFDERGFLSAELAAIGKSEFGVDITVCSESDEDVYDPKGRAAHARPFKPAILVE